MPRRGLSKRNQEAQRPGRARTHGNEPIYMRYAGPMPSQKLVPDKQSRRVAVGWKKDCGIFTTTLERGNNSPELNYIYGRFE